MLRVHRTGMHEPFQAPSICGLPLPLWQPGLQKAREVGSFFSPLVSETFVTSALLAGRGEAEAEAEAARGCAGVCVKCVLQQG
jgi:hypothetical protein